MWGDMEGGAVEIQVSSDLLWLSASVSLEFFSFKYLIEVSAKEHGNLVT